MKRIIFIAVTVICFLLQTAPSCAQVVVNIMPTVVVKQRPPIPGPDYIWVEPEWVWRGTTYVQVDGYWTPLRAGYYYKPGKWHGKPGGYRYIGGKWHKKKHK